MKINDRYFLKSDTYNVTLYENYEANVLDEDKQPTGETETRSRVAGYYSNPKAALKDLVRLEVMGSGMEDLTTVVDLIDDLRADIEKWISGGCELDGKDSE